MPSREMGSLLAAAAFALLAVGLFYFRKDNGVCCKFIFDDRLVTSIEALDVIDAVPSKAMKDTKKRSEPPARKREPKAKNNAILSKELKDTATGISLPRTKHFSRSELVCLGVGVRAKSIAIAKVNVYTVGLYVDARHVRGALRKFAGAEPSKLKTDASLFKVLGQAGRFTKYLHLVFARNVGAQKMVDALTSVKGVEEDILERFSSMILGAIGSNIEKGESISLGWEGKDKMVVVVRDKVAGTVVDAALPNAVFDLYLGSNPVSPAAKAAFGEGVSSLLNS